MAAEIAPDRAQVVHVTVQLQVAMKAKNQFAKPRAATCIRSKVAKKSVFARGTSPLIAEISLDADRCSWEISFGRVA